MRVLVEQILASPVEIRPQLGDFLVILQLHILHHLLMAQLQLLQLQFQTAHLLLQRGLLRHMLLGREGELFLCVSLDVGRVVLVLVEEVLDLLLVHFDLGLVLLLGLFEYAILVEMERFGLGQFALRDLPEFMDLVLLLCDERWLGRVVRSL